MKEESIPEVIQSSATELPYPDNYFDAVFTDPPYYDNVNYSVLSDFFYVWLKRSIGDLYPELFMTPLTPKSKEIVADPIRHESKEQTVRFFEDMLKKSFKEIHRVLKPGGIGIIVYAHKTTSGWETLINALLESDLIPTASWPIDTEMKARLLSQESAALASSIYIIVRKLKREEQGWFEEIKKELHNHIEGKLQQLWKDGIRGADYFIAAIGASLEVFGKYKTISTYEGEIIKADKMIETIRNIVTDYIIREILHNGIADQLSPLTKFYILYRWNYGQSKVIFDEAKKLAQSVGVNLEDYWNKKSFIKKDKEYIEILGPEKRNLKDLEEPEDLIDVLHKALILWKSGEKEELKELLIKSGFGEKDVFYKVGQAISEIYPMGSSVKEKQWLEGFLAGSKELKGALKGKGQQLMDYQD